MLTRLFPIFAIIRLIICSPPCVFHMYALAPTLPADTKVFNLCTPLLPNVAMWVALRLGALRQPPSGI